LTGEGVGASEKVIVERYLEGRESSSEDDWISRGRFDLPRDVGSNMRPTGLEIVLSEYRLKDANNEIHTEE